jgi:hypothetical protein
VRSPRPLRRERSLTDPWLAAEERNLQPPAIGLRPHVVEERELGRTPGERKHRGGRLGEAGGKRNTVVAAGSLSPLNLDCAHRMRNALQFQLAERYKLDGRVAADHRAHGVGCQDLTSVGRRAQAGRLDHGIAEVVAFVFGDFSARNPDTDRERNRGSAIMPLDALLHRDGTGQGTAWRGERDHEPVAEILDLSPCGRDDRLTKHREVRLPQPLGFFGVQARADSSRSDQIGEHQCDGDRRAHVSTSLPGAYVTAVRRHFRPRSRRKRAFHRFEVGSDD